MVGTVLNTVLNVQDTAVVLEKVPVATLKTSDVPTDCRVSETEGDWVEDQLTGVVGSEGVADVTQLTLPIANDCLTACGVDKETSPVIQIIAVGIVTDRAKRRGLVASETPRGTDALG